MPQTMTSESLDTATISFDGEHLVADTGRLRRIWRWTGHGLRTCRIDRAGGGTWQGDDDLLADWQLPTAVGENPAATIVDVSIKIGDDAGFTSQHLAACIDLHYPEAALQLRLVVWAYPGAPGIRSQLWLRATEAFSWRSDEHRSSSDEHALRIAELAAGYRRLDCLPCEPATALRRNIGYHSDTQNRNDAHLDILLEAVDHPPLRANNVCQWANIACCEADGQGLAMLKESHHAANKNGHDTGCYIHRPGIGIQNQGWGILPGEIDDRWRAAWATWAIAYAATDVERQRAIKTCDQLRFPVPADTVRLQANTWGSSRGWLEHREAAGEERVLRELDSCADLDIDILQIDDGWQGNTYESWTPDPQRYPSGWAPVRSKAAELGVTLGLWLAAQPPSLEELQATKRDGGFRSYKLDFAHLNSKQAIDELMDKCRAFIGDDHELRINWDLTEIIPRYGFYFAREFGNIYLENRKPVLPRSTTYRPSTVLRDLWQLAHYCNLFNFQGSTQNVDLVDPLFSDAALHGHDYCLAITLMSSPLIFSETQRYDESARAQLRPLIAAYKRVRSELVTGMVFPLGDKPCGSAHSGFASVCGSGDHGYLTCFREVANTQPELSLRLPDQPSGRIHLEDLLSGETWTSTLEAGRFCCTIDRAPGYRFLAYRLSAD